MRYLLFALSLAALAGLTAGGQEIKGKKGAKEEEKKEDPAVQESMQIKEIAGKSLEEWIKELHSKDPSKRNTAIRTVLQFGPEKAYKAVPDLIDELKKHRPGYPIDMSVRVSGGLALGMIIGGVKEPEQKHARDAVAILRTFLKDPQQIVKLRALEALPGLGPEARAAVPEVLILVRDPDTWETRQAAIQALIPLVRDPKGLPSTTVIAALEKALKDSSAQVRFTALQAIAAVAAPGNPAEKAGILRELRDVSARDADPAVQLWSHMAIMTVKQAITPDQLTPVAKMVQHPDVTIRVQAAQALGMVGKDAKLAVPAVTAGLNDPAPEVVAACIVALIQMDAKSAVPALRKLNDSPVVTEVLKKAATQAADQIEKGPAARKAAAADEKEKEKEKEK